jgi:hypothetical protein
MANRRQLASPSSLQRRQERLRKAVRRQLQLETLEDRRVFASPQLVSINPNNSDIFNLAGAANLRNVAPRELTFRFNDGMVINPATVTLTANNVRLVRAGVDGTFGNADDVTITPGYVGIGEAPNEVVMRFQENLPDDKYRVTLVGAGANPIRNSNIAGDPLNNGAAFNNGANRSVDFELDLGAQVVAVVPQPVDRVSGQWTQRANQIDVYFNKDDLNPSLAQNVNFYNLIFTRDTVSNTDDLAFAPTSATYNAALDKVTLTFASPINQLVAGGGTFRLRVGTNEVIPAVPTQTTVNVDPGSSFTAANDLGVIGATGKILTSAVGAAVGDVALIYPGSNGEPGHRFQELAETHLDDGDGDGTVGTPTMFYNFASPLPGGGNNYITEAQKQRTREIYEIYSAYLGIDFVESATQGTTVATGDLVAANGVSRPGGVAGLGSPSLAIMDVAELDWNDDYGGSWFNVALHEIGHSLLFGHSYDLPPGTTMGSDGLMGFNNNAEPVFPGPYDIVHGQYLHRPDSLDIDLYKFQVTTAGTFSAEIFAERLADSSSLDSMLRLYKEVNGVRTLVSQNDDYYSEDSFLKLKLTAGTYYVGVSSTGNDDYDPTIANTGANGTSQGLYDLRLNFRADISNTLTDTTGVAFDGDLDGIAGGVYDFWFRVADPNKTLFVDKTAGGGGSGSLASPYNNLQTAFNAATPGSIVRVLGNGGADGNLLTTADTVPYLIGSDPGGNVLPDGRNLDVPKGVTLMIDAGAVFKVRRGTFSVGTNSSGIDRSAAALQVLGTPVQSVFFTSYFDDSFSGDTNADTNSTSPGAGNWGGIIFENDFDRANQRFDYEQQGIFLNYVNHADIRYGGGAVSLGGGSAEPSIAPIYLAQARPTITFNTIVLSADSAISADPNSFEETNFHAPAYQRTGAFTSDYDRVGPDIYGNRLFSTVTVNSTTTAQANSLNGLFIRISTPATGTLEKLTTSARFDDLDIVHILTENLIIEGTPGGGLQDLDVPDISLVTLTPASGGTLPAGTYQYVVTFVDINGNETAPSLFTSQALTLTGAANSSAIRLDNLPTAPAGYVARRIYRHTGSGATGTYVLAAQVVTNTTSFLDTGASLGGSLPVVSGSIHSRTDARLAIDPGVVLKMRSSRIEATISSQFIAEGTAELPIVITSLADDRYGAGGTFDQTGTNTPNTPARGNWGGIMLGPTSTGSLDHVVLAYGGGTVNIAGVDVAYNVLEVHQAQARIAHSVFEQNAAGVGGNGPGGRFGVGDNTPATLFVRGAQPVIIDNVIRNNAAAAISINVNSLDHSLVVDYGRSTGGIDRLDGYKDNQGALVRLNRLLNNGTNGMVIRGETMQTEGVWDDTDITHVLLSTIYVANFHTYTGLRLQSSQSESLVIKLSGPTAGITATGKPLDIDDRIGGILNVVGQPGRPVIFTSLNDDTVGAGKRPDGKPQLDTNNNGTATTAAAGDWRSILIDQYANDRNVEVIVESESAAGASPGTNANPSRAQTLGALSGSGLSADENVRLGYVVHGLLNAANDVDVYKFTAKGGTEVWLDVDQTTFALDAVLELVNLDGDVIARSNDSYTESLGSSVPGGIAKLMQKTPPYNGVDYWGVNPRDPGMRVVLPGAPNTTNDFYVRVRSNSAQLDTNVGGGLTSGVYQLQVRTREIDEQPGTTVRFANISYATNGIEVYGQPTHSQLVGEGGENLSPNDTLATATNLGNILNTDRMAMSIAGSLGKQGLSDNLQLADVDFYRFDVRYDAIQQIAGVTPGSIFSTIFDVDYADRVQNGDVALWLFDSSGRLIVGNQDSNVGDDSARALHADDTADLSRGTTSSFDPYIGAQVLPEGTYYVAVASNGSVRTVDPVTGLVTLTPILPTALAQPQVRLEPIDSLLRIVEDHIGTSGGSTAAAPVVPVLVDTSSAVPYFLGDVSLFLSQERPNVAPFSTRLLTIDPFTGHVETVVNANLGDSTTSFSYDIGDIAFRADGQLFTLSKGNDSPSSVSDANSGNYVQIDTGNGVATFVGDDGIVTYQPDPANPANPLVANLQPSGARIGYGVQFNAILYYVDGNRVQHLYGIGNRGDSSNEGNVGPNGVTTKDNLLYELDLNTGAVLFDSNAGTLAGPATDAAIFNEILTAPRITAPDATTLGPNNSTVFNLQDGNTISVQDGSVATDFEFDAGYDILQSVNLATGATVRDGNFFVLDNRVFQINTGSVIEINVNGSTLTDGIVVSVNTGVSSASFEFDNSPPASAGPPAVPATPQTDPSAKPIVFGPGTSSIQLAGLLAAAINAAALKDAANNPLTAAAVGNRVTLVNELTAELVLPPGAPANQVIIAGDSGPAPIVQVTGPATAALDGKTFSIGVQFQQGGPTQTVTFEFDNNGISGANNTTIFAVPFNVGMTPDQVASNIRQAALTAANNGWPITSQLAFDKVVFNGRGAQFGASNAAQVSNLPVTALINVEESYTSAQIGQQVKTVVNTVVGAPPIAGAENDRINFINVTKGEFYVATWNVVAQPGVSPGTVAIPFLSDDGPSQVATRIAAAINSGIPGINAIASGPFVRLSRGSATVQAPVIAAGEGPGGFITGMAQIGGFGGTMYAVSSNGGLYTISTSVNAGIPSAVTTYVASSRNELEGIEFSSLTAGPAGVENGRYANMLFATTQDGRVYAMDTAGHLQSVFLNGATSVDTGLSDVNGLAFGNLTKNLWTQTTNRGGDTGHGIAPNFDGSRIARPGGTSLYFGTNVQPGTNYNFNGGAYGTVVTNEFSLEGYSRADQPKLYFTYYMQGDGSADAFKVYVSGQDGDWTLLNTVTTSNGAWLQSNVSLASVVGQDHLRLRFDFSTAGDMNVGDIYTTGDELRAVAAEFIDDGDEFDLDGGGFQVGGKTFEFELGPTIIADSGAAMRDGETFTLTTAAGSRTFEFDNNGALNGGGNRRVSFTNIMTPAEVAASLQTAIAGAGLAGVNVYLIDNRVNVKGLTGYTQSGAARLQIAGTVGVSFGNIPVDINLSMTRTQVAAVIDQVFENTLVEQRLVLDNGSAYADGQRFSLTDPVSNVTEIFEFDTGYVLQIPAAGTGAGGIVDGNNFKITNGAATTVFVFDTNSANNYVAQPGETVRTITLVVNASQAAVSRAIETAVNAAGLGGAGIQATYLGNGRVQLGGNTGVVLNRTGTPTLGSTGTPGVGVGNVRMFISPNAGFTAANVATVVSNAFNSAANALPNGYSSRIDAFDPSRVVIEKSSETLANLVLAPLTSAISMQQTNGAQQTNGISKQYKDLLRVIGHTVTFAGPLGLEQLETPNPNLPGLEQFYVDEGVENWLAGDQWSYPYYDPNDPDYFGLANRRVGFNSPVRGQANNFEGFYLDDIIIGFAERGEIVVGATADSTFTLPAAVTAITQTTNDAISYPYQLEIRGGENYATGGRLPGAALPVVQLLKSFDTNTRLAQGFEVQVPAGSDLVDGQWFVLTDGVYSVRFEFDDVRAANSVTPGSQRIAFSSTDPDYVVAQRLRDAINGTTVQSLLSTITASLSDGSLTGGGSTDNLVLLTGPASLKTTNLQVSQTTTDANLLRDTLLGPGITPVGEATLVSSSNSAGLFRGGKSVIGIDGGIILSTGDVRDAEGPNYSDRTTGSASGFSDDDLDNTFNTFTADTTSLEFSFNFPGGDLSFDFVFASEEYNEFVNSFFNDVFAFYLSGGALVAAENLAVVPGTNTPVSIDTVNGGNPLGSNNATNSAFYVNNDPTDNGGFLKEFGYDGFTTVFKAQRLNLPAGTYTIKLAIADVFDSNFDSAVFLEAGSLGVNAPAVLVPPQGVPGLSLENQGDTNRVRDQGQIILSSNYVTNSQQYGIVIDAGQRLRPDLAPGAGDLPHPGVVRNLRTINGERLIPGVVAVNNVISTFGTGGIHVSGDANAAAPTQLSPVPFARVVNNTIYGGGTGVGIAVDQNASPTLMNNIVASLATGVSVDASSSTTVLQGMLYKGNTTNTTGTSTGFVPLVLAAADPLFVNAAKGNFYPAAGSLAIDSSVYSLPDRNNFVNYKAQVGIGTSPILAPERDVTGQKRQDIPGVGDDGTGTGQSVFQDRGALDRVDFAGPTAILTNPQDNDATGIDSDPGQNDVSVNGFTFTQFSIQLLEGVDPFEATAGSGVDDSSIDPTASAANANKVTITRNGTTLVRGTDYVLSYDALNDTLAIIPLTGVWQLNSTYVITLDNSATGIKDLAGNSLKANRANGTTSFTIRLGASGSGGGPTVSTMDFGDAPSRYPVSSPTGASHTVTAGFQLGAIVTVEPNGLASANATGDNGDDGVVFVNGASVFRGRTTTQVSVVASQAGIVNAWIDFNADGDWDDPFEQIVTDEVLVGGVQETLTYSVPDNAAIGTTFARFRLNKEGNLGPTGPALNGEVEDYLVNIIVNPYLNPNNRYDVSGDNRVSPLDALLVINRLNSGGGLTGTAPPYLDVSGDGTLAAIDALMVINYLNARGTGEGEAASVDVNPVAAASNSGSDVAEATGTASTSDEPNAAAAPTAAPLALLPPVLGTIATSTSTASEPSFDYGDFAAADSSFLPYSSYEAADDRDDDLDAILGGSNGGESADDFFAWFGQ